MNSRARLLRPLSRPGHDGLANPSMRGARVHNNNNNKVYGPETSLEAKDPWLSLDFSQDFTKPQAPKLNPNKETFPTRSL